MSLMDWLFGRQLASDEEFRSRFIHEWRGAASLYHPNILPVFDAGDDQGDLYIATRLVDGEDLRRVIECDGLLKFATCRFNLITLQ